MSELKLRLKESLGLLKEARKLGCKKLIVLVSTGKDSVCLFDVIYNLADRAKIEPFFAHHYIVDGLEIEEKVLTNLETRFGVKIHRYENSTPKMMLMQDVLCVNLADNKLTKEMPVTKYKIDTQIDRALFRKYNTKWITMGIKKADSVNRRYALNEYPNPNPRKMRVYPLTNWSNQEVLEYIEKRDLPLSEIYKVSKRSLDSLELESAYPLKSLSPNDYNKICEKYPFLDALCWVYEKRIREYGQKNIPRC